MEIIFQPSGKKITATSDETFARIAVRAGIVLNLACGSGGTCGKCRIRVCSGQVSIIPSNHRMSETDSESGWCLACSTRPVSDCVVEVPDFHAPVILTGTEGIGKAAGEIREPAIAVDLGTTTIAVALVDLFDGTVRDAIGDMNGQILYGSDVLSRLLKIRTGEISSETMQAAAVGPLNKLIGELCERMGVSGDTIKKVSLAGNTAMQQLFLGIDSFGLTELPFQPAFKDSLTVSAEQVNLTKVPNAEIRCFPQFGGFVGGDTAAAMLASDFDTKTSVSLMIDIGTNGEIVVRRGNKNYCASTAAGPAFEGARIHQGMRAVPGAIDKISFKDSDISCSVIGGIPAVGICGTGLIDAVAELLRLGVIASDGLISMPNSLPDAVKLRVGAEGVCLAPGVLLTQQDIREFQLAAAAIRAGAETLLVELGIAPEAVEEFLLAGAFGTYLNKENALRAGLLPTIDARRIRYIGNASLSGACLRLTTPSETRLNVLVAQTTHIELASMPSFQDAYLNAMLFPEK